jgi:RNA polymerase sigma factor (sigma-70 family)
MSDTDLELLARYTRQHAEDAFAEIVRRHLGLVYSAALRQVRSPQLAEEVAQSVFIDLGRSAAKLKPDTILTAWLYQVTRRTAIDVVRREASRQLREQIATEMNAMNATATDWTHIEPLLDEAMHALDDTDRAAVLLRYFENKSLREVGATLGTSENAAQKRLGRAVERLREFFAKRGITVGASGLVVVISANAVQAAPVGLAVAISSAAALAGTTILTATTATLGKAIAMTMMQKVLVAVAFAAVVGTAIYEARQASGLRDEKQTLLAQQDQLTSEQDKALSAAAASTENDERLRREKSELLRLRGEVGMLRNQLSELQKLRAERDRLAQQSQSGASPSPEIDPFDKEHGPGAGAKAQSAKHWSFALINYAENHQGQFPASLEQASSFFRDGLSPEAKEAVQATDRFEILFHGVKTELDPLPPESTIILREKQPWMDKEGLWCKAYGMSDGSSMIRQSLKNDFEQWESIRMPTRKVSYPASK